MNNIIVRETRLPNPDRLHEYNIYIPYQNGYVNVYTCMHCSDVFASFVENIEEADTNVYMKNIPLATLKHWRRGLVNVNKQIYKVAYAYLQEYLENKFPNQNKPN